MTSIACALCHAAPTYDVGSTAPRRSAKGWQSRISSVRILAHSAVMLESSEEALVVQIDMDKLEGQFDPEDTEEGDEPQ